MKFLSKEKLTSTKEKKLKRKPYNILLVDDEPANLRVLTELLESDYQILTANNGEKALEIITDNSYTIDLIVSDQRMPSMTGVELFKKVVSLAPFTKRIILTGFTDIDEIIEAINEGNIYKFLTKPVDPQNFQVTVKRAIEAYELEKENQNLVSELKELNYSLENKVKERTAELEIKNRELEMAYLKLEDMSLTDPLTNLKNRRYMEKILKKGHQAQYFINESNAENILKTFFIMIDLDHFKSINDDYGHHTGDRILVETSNILKSSFRDSDVVRWGGEEFLVILKDVNQENIGHIVERVRQKIEEYPFFTDDVNKIKRTASMGFACYPFWFHHHEYLSHEQVIQLADMALYAAKQSGRNNWVGIFPKNEKETFLPDDTYNDKVSKLKDLDLLSIKTSLADETKICWQNDKF